MKTQVYVTKELRQTDYEQYLKHLKFYNKALQDLECKLDTLKEIVLNSGNKMDFKIN